MLQTMVVTGVPSQVANAGSKFVGQACASSQVSSVSPPPLPNFVSLQFGAVRRHVAAMGRPTGVAVALSCADGFGVLPPPIASVAMVPATTTAATAATRPAPARTFADRHIRCLLRCCCHHSDDAARRKVPDALTSLSHDHPTWSYSR
jgi:hypothetical protein